MLTCRPNRVFAGGGEVGVPLGVSLLSDGLDRMFNELWNGARPGQPGRVIPPLNVWEDEDAVHVEAELPGMTEKDVDVQVLGGGASSVTITGARTISAAENAVYHRRERGAGRFTRTLRLGVEVDAERASAAFEQGVLHITLPKAEAAKPRRIAVKGG